MNKVHYSHSQVEELYRAMRTFDDLMNSEENHIRLKMKPGDMVTVKNTRIMHGRSDLGNIFFIGNLRVSPMRQMKGRFQKQIDNA